MLKKAELNRIKKQIGKSETRWSKLFDALGDGVRYRMFKLLAKRKDVCVSELAELFMISTPAASQQLKILELNGLVKKERMGQSICYCVDKGDPMVKSIVKLITK